METPQIFDEFKAAESTEERKQVLRLEDIEWSLPPEDLIHYYLVDPEAVRHWVDGQIKWRAQWGEVPDTNEFRKVLRDTDPVYALELFRRTCGDDEWFERVEELIEEHAGEELVARLERIHPTIPRSLTGATVQLTLLRRCGEDARRYVRAHLSEPWANSGFDPLIDYLEEQGDWELWDAAVSGQPSRQLDQYVRRVLDEADQRPGWARERLEGIAGASYVDWTGRTTARLGDDVTRDVYRRFPNLLKTRLDEHVGPGHFTARHHGYRETFRELVRAGDLEYFDRLAGKFLSQAIYVWGRANHYESVFEHLTDHYEDLTDDAEFAGRATRVLAAFGPADEEHWFTQRGNNPLSDLFFEQPERFSAAPELVSDLLESSFFTVRSLGFRALLELGERCGEMAARHANLVLAAPLDRLSARGMRAALAAIRAMAEYDETLSRIALERMRDASSLAYPSFSRGELVRTMGQILKRSPQLRRASEQPIIYENHLQGGDWA